ncbi:site-specific recombinase XerD [Pseudomonas duriflava]|uniref:Site-specific recombinase XerD n=1 Tax=Pseudomonas duriflava TaxID=459528 RepID=A0A562QAQ7_9PSED|nr:site-specific integrase [Pseudomonas duriflava]TWI53832.1 site-specific recombinase XerD [Pseudomonas duriflava]
MGTMATPWKHPTSGYYYIRRAVPKDLQESLGSIYKKTLGTKDPHEAKSLFAAAWVQSEERFALARAQLEGGTLLGAKDVQQLAVRWFSLELSKMEASGDFTPFLYVDSEEGASSLRDFLEESSKVAGIVNPFISATLEAHKLPAMPASAPLHKQLVEAFTTHLLKLSDLALARYSGNWTVKPDVLPVAPITLEQRSETRLLSDIFSSFKKDKLATEGDSRTIRKTLDEYQSVVTRFIELFGDLPVTQIDRQAIQNFHMALHKMPSKGDGIRSMNAREMIAKAESEGLPTLTAATIKTRLRILSAVLGFALNMGVIKENPVVASGVAKRLSKTISKGASSRRRKDYTLEELKVIFTSPVYTEEGRSPPKKDLGKALYWIPLLAAYTGARREELAQLFVRDIREEEGIPCLSILEANDGDEEETRTVKTVGSRRLVPIHSDLIALGFLEYVKGLPRDGQLFPALKPNAEGWYGKIFGKHRGKYLREVAKLDSPASPSHGFRHTFKTLCRSVGIPEDVHDAITGHSDGSVSRGYGSMPLSRLAQELEKIPSIARESGLL